MYDSARPFYPWIAAIAVRLALTWLRRNQRLERREGAALETAPEPGTPAIGASRLADAERHRRLWDEVQSLSAGERTVVLLYYRDELPVADIAEALGFTPGTVKTLLFRARKHLREKLGRNDDIDG
jgi:RNA polymerase sigma-70 factor (ECF subfamily)